MSITNFSIDFSETDKVLKAILETDIPDYAKKGLQRMAKTIIRDALKISPTVPRGHARKKAGKRSGTGGTLRQSWKIETQPDGTIILGFDTPYAAYQHEGQRLDGSRPVKNYSTAGSGAKFIQKKMEQYKDVYFKDLADFIKIKAGT